LYFNKTHSLPKEMQSSSACSLDLISGNMKTLICVGGLQKLPWLTFSFLIDLLMTHEALFHDKIEPLEVPNIKVNNVHYIGLIRDFRPSVSSSIEPTVTNGLKPFRIWLRINASSGFND
jgi:hypothetical protein